MGKSRHILLLSTILLSHAVFAADDMSVKLKGQIDFTAGYYEPEKKDDYQRLTPNKKHYGFYNTTTLGVSVKAITDDELEYGAQIGIHTTAKSSRKHPSFLYIASDYGKVELGSGQSAMNKMKITGYSNSCALGNSWDMWAALNPIHFPEIAYLSDNSNYLDAKTRDSKSPEYSRKVTYYSPEVSGFQFGVSYVPDAANLGFESMDIQRRTKKATIPNYQFAIKDGVAAGISYKYSFTDNYHLRASFTGEHGKVIPFEMVNDKAVLSDNKFRNLNTYNVGAELKIYDTSIAGSYANHLKSFTGKNANLVDNKATTSLYSIGLRHNIGKVGVSSTYFESNHRKNGLRAVTLAAEYKVMPGLLPYAQWTQYLTKARYNDNQKVYHNEKRHGQVMFVGAKLQF